MMTKNLFTFLTISAGSLLVAGAKTTTSALRGGQEQEQRQLTTHQRTRADVEYWEFDLCVKPTKKAKNNHYFWLALYDRSYETEYGSCLLKITTGSSKDENYCCQAISPNGKTSIIYDKKGKFSVTDPMAINDSALYVNSTKYMSCGQGGTTDCFDYNYLDNDMSFHSFTLLHATDRATLVEMNRWVGKRFQCGLGDYTVCTESRMKRETYEHVHVGEVKTQNTRDAGSVLNQHKFFFDSQDPPRLTDPRAFLDDLKDELRKFHQNGDHSSSLGWWSVVHKRRNCQKRWTMQHKRAGVVTVILHRRDRLIVELATSQDPEHILKLSLGMIGSFSTSIANGKSRPMAAVDLVSSVRIPQTGTPTAIAPWFVVLPL